MTVSTAAAHSQGSPSEPRAARGLRVMRVGVLGLGNVGQAVVRAAAASGPSLREQGIAIAVACALVRDVAKPRRCPRVARVTSNVEAFLRGRYDVVIDALAGREPAAAIVGRLLGKGIPVVTANKALVAAAGRRLRRVAARGGTSLRVEASVMAGVPFLGAFERRPLAAHVTRFAGVVNGTSNFILTRMSGGTSFQAALAEAQALGYAEPDPAADLSGRDAREKLVVLADLLLGLPVAASSISVEGIEGITPDMLAAAETLGGALKPVVIAAGGHLLSAFAGPAWVPASHPLASISGRDNAIVIDSRHAGRLVFAGPGAGPDVTAATLLDDAIEAASEHRGHASRAVVPEHRIPSTAAVRAPETGWFIRVSSGEDVDEAFIALQLRVAGLAVDRQVREPSAILLLIGTAPADRVAVLAATLRARGAAVHAWRTLHG